VSVCTGAVSLKGLLFLPRGRAVLGVMRGLSKAAFESKDARWVGAGGNGMKQGLLKN